MNNHDDPQASNGTQETRLNRRSLLSKAAVGASGLVGVAGSASAVSGTETHRRQKVLQFRESVDSKTAFETHADDLVAILSSEGLIERPDISILTTAAENDSNIGTVEENDRLVPHVQTRFEVSDGRITAIVHEETGRTYAYYRPDTEERKLFIDGDAQKTIDVEDCITHEDCESEPCEKGYYDYSGTLYETTCCGGGLCGKEKINCCTGG